MTPVEATARGRVIAGGERDPADVAIEILQRVSEDDSLSLRMSAQALRGAALHHARIVAGLSFMADELDAELSPARKRWRVLVSRIASAMTPRSSRIAADLSVSLGCAVMSGRLTLAAWGRARKDGAT